VFLQRVSFRVHNPADERGFLQSYHNVATLSLFSHFPSHRDYLHCCHLAVHRLRWNLWRKYGGRQYKRLKENFSIILNYSKNLIILFFLISSFICRFIYNNKYLACSNFFNNIVQLDFIHLNV
jgi:hypothetical protein